MFGFSLYNYNGFLFFNQASVFAKLKLTNIICIPSLVISQVANMGSFAVNFGSNATTSAEGNDNDNIEENGKLFGRPT